MILKKIGIAFTLMMGALAYAEPLKPGNYQLELPMPSLAGITKSPRIKYDIDMKQEKFFVHVPDNYNDQDLFGLVISLHVIDDSAAMSSHTIQAYRDKKIIMISPQKAGNTHPADRRWGLTVLAALSARQQFKIDPDRIYAGGWFDGGRVSDLLVMMQPDVFAGAVSTCGAAFYEPVEHTHPAGPKRPQGKYDSMLSMEPDDIDRAKQSLRFAFITNADDPFHGDVLDIALNGYDKQKFNYRLFDLQTGNTDPFSAETMAAAITFLDGAPKRSTVTQLNAPGTDASGAAHGENSGIPQREKPVWASKDPAQWPVLALHNNIRFKNNTVANGGTGFLIRLPNNAVAAVTVHHVIEDVVPQLEQFNNAVSRPSMVSPLVPARQVPLGKLAMKLPLPPKLDLLIVSVPQLSSWPAETLAPRPAHAAVGDKIFVVDVRKGKQTLFATTVTRAGGKERVFNYQATPEFNSMGLSGAPIVDENGFLVGIHRGRVEENGKRFDGIALDMTYVMEWVDAPEPPKSLARSPETPTTQAAPASEKPIIMR